MVFRIKKFCRKDGRKFFLSNNFKVAFELKLDGVYLPSFNNDLKHRIYPRRKNFLILGSAHNYIELKQKEIQNVDIIFLASLFNKKKTYLGINRFISLSKLTKKKLVALGGINNTNLNKLRLLNIYGYSGISLFNSKKNGPQKMRAVKFSKM